MVGVESRDGKGSAGEVDRAVEGWCVTGIPCAAGVEIEGLARGVDIVGEGAGRIEGARSEGIELAGIEGLHVERTAGEIDGAVERWIVASVPPTTGVEVEGLARSVGVVGEGAGDVEGAGGEGIELAGVEGVHIEGSAGEIDRAAEGGGVASIPRAAGVEVESLIGGAGVVGEGAGGFERAGGEGEVAHTEGGGLQGAAVEGGGVAEGTTAGNIDRVVGGDGGQVGQAAGGGEGAVGEGEVVGVVGGDAEGAVVLDHDTGQVIDVGGGRGVRTPIEHQGHRGFRPECAGKGAFHRERGTTTVGGIEIVISFFSSHRAVVDDQVARLDVDIAENRINHLASGGEVDREVGVIKGFEDSRRERARDGQRAATRASQ